MWESTGTLTYFLRNGLWGNNMSLHTRPFSCCQLRFSLSSLDFSGMMSVAVLDIYSVWGLLFVSCFTLTVSSLLRVLLTSSVSLKRFLYLCLVFLLLCDSLIRPLYFVTVSSLCRYDAVPHFFLSQFV